MNARQAKLKQISAIAALITLFSAGVFALNYAWLNGAFPGYRLILAPGNLALRLVSEETAFAPKLALLLTGQFVGYFFIFYLVSEVRSLLKRISRQGQK